MKARALKLVFAVCIVIVTMALFSVAVSAETEGELTYGDLTYVITADGEITITDCSLEAVGEISIPKKIGDHYVTAIGDLAFYNCTSITKVTLPSYLTSIGDSAFYNCTGLASISLPSLVESIGASAFRNCSSMKYCYLSAKVTEIKDHTFFGCSSLTNIAILQYVVSIGQEAFRDCTSMTRVSLYEGALKSIGYSAFRNCTSLKSIVIPNCVESISDYVFFGCSSLESITIPFVGNRRTTSSDTYQYPFGYIFGGGEYANSYTAGQHFHGSSLSTTTSDSYSIPNSLKSVTVTGGNILRGAFEDCRSITSVSLPDDITSIGDRAFYNCSLTSFSIPSSVTSIGRRAFALNDFTSVVVPDSVTSIGEGAFYCYSKLTSITLPFVGDRRTTSSDTYQYPLGYIFGMNQDYNYTGQYYIGSDTELLTYSRFYIPSSLSSVTITGGNISPGAFSNCSMLTSITLFDGVTGIGSKAFYSCQNLTSINIPSCVTSIGSQAFYNCDNLTSINIPSRVTSIGSHAFYNCKNLTSINIPSSVESIIEGAFAYCSKLQSISVSADNPVYRNDGNCLINTADGVLVLGFDNSIIPSDGSVTRIGKYAFASRKNLVSIDIPASVKSIGDSAFVGCSNLKTIAIPEGVTTINSYTFSDCYSLESIVIPSTVRYIEEYAFWWCEDLSTVYFCEETGDWSSIDIDDTEYANDDLKYSSFPCHKYQVIVEPTCTEEGVIAKTCFLCDQEYDHKSIPAVGHIVSTTNITVKNDITYPFALSEDGVYSSTNKALDSSSTFTITAVRDYQLKLEYSVSCGSYDYLTIRKNGTLLYSKSSVVSWTTVNISLNAGDVLTISYTRNGYYSYNANTAYFRLDGFQSYEYTTTCTETLICEVCHEEVEPTQIIHSYGDWVTVIANTCTEVGLEKRTCSECGGVETNRIAAAHSYGDWVTDVEPSCTTDGSRSKVCGRCSDTETEILSALGHNETSHNAKSPTCTEIGWNAYVTCSRCDYSTYAEQSALGHNEISHEAKAPTCTKIGWDAYVTCSRCSYSTRTDIAALGHDEISHEAKAPTCTELGWDAYVTCSRCDYSTYAEQSALGHDEIHHEAKAPTFTEIGWDAYVTCSRCDHSTYVELPATSSPTELFTYTITDGKVSIISCNTQATSIIIPAEIEGCPVTEIREGAFSGCSSLVYVTVPYIGGGIEANGSTFGYIFGTEEYAGSTAVKQYYASGVYNTYYIPDSLQHIYVTGGDTVPYGAFDGLRGVVSINLPESILTVGNCAFRNCTSIVGISIPESVRSIGDKAFYGCSALASIVIPEGVETMGVEIFYNCTSLETAALPSTLAAITSKAFYNCTSLASVTIPNGITSIDYYAFFKCALVDLSIPSTVTSIGEGAFRDCKMLVSIYYNAANAADTAKSGNRIFQDAGKSAGGITLTIGNRVERIPAYLFYPHSDPIYTPKITHVVLEAGSVCIATGASIFYDCNAISRVTVYDVGEWCNINFGNATANPLYYAKKLYLGDELITNLVIPEGTVSIRRAVFYNATSITSVAIPASVKSISNDIFTGSGLRSVTYCGTEDNWAAININSANSKLTGATRYYHMLGEWQVTLEPTCTENGIKAKLCEHCGFECEREILPALGHRFTEGPHEVDPITTVNDATYPFSYSDGTYSSTNKSNNSTSVFTITAHYDCTVQLSYFVSSEQNYDKMIIARNGTALYTLSGTVNWNTVTIVLSAGDTLTVKYHKDYSQSHGLDTARFRLEYENVIITNDKREEELEDTCYDVACSYCDGIVKYAVHDEIPHEAQAPTCTEIGWDAYVTCSKCDHSTYVEQSALGHDEVSHEAKAPTCTEVGWDAYVGCSRCDRSDRTEIPALGHNEISHEAKAPTCTEGGWDAYVTCSRCDHSTYAELSALGHDEIHHDAKTPTCTESGWDAYVTCSRCDHTTYVEFAASHFYSEWQMIIPPDEDGDGFKTRNCSVCGDTQYERVAFASGDIDGDGMLTNTDIALAIRALSGWNNISRIARADFNYDGRITNRDIIELIKKLELVN